MAPAGLGFEVLGGGLRSSRAPGRRRPGWCRAPRPGCRPGDSRVPRDGSRRSARGPAGRVIYPNYVSVGLAGLLSARVSTACKSRAHGLEPCGARVRRGLWVLGHSGYRLCLEGAAGTPAGRAVGRGGGGRHGRARAAHMYVPCSLPRAQNFWGVSCCGEVFCVGFGCFLLVVVKITTYWREMPSIGYVGLDRYRLDGV